MTPTDTRNPIDTPPGRNGPNDTRQCNATARSTGKRCQRRPIPGGTVCKLHGGAAPQVKERARLRLLSLVEPSIATLAREMTNADRSSDRQRAANSILDRSGYGRTVKVESEDAREMLVDLLLSQDDDKKGKK